ncbi:MAG TPA: glucose 1-dehydrogenase [Bacteroidota bacterium]|jgi:NAD(P)-dependent dehydrogenase (short-subunit alcohol dehydrogenase family)
MDQDFSGKVFVVTGASSGIGKATALMAAARGAKVSFAARREKELKTLSASFPPEQVEVIAADVTNEEDRRRIVNRTLERFGGIDVLVNAAGIIASGTIETTTLDEWDRMFDINIRSLFRLTQLALPSIIERKGNIVNLSSVTGIRAFPGVLSYCVSKAGVDQLTHCAALELGPKGVRMNAVDPGVVVTNLHRTSGMAEEAYGKFLEHSKTTHPIGRVGSPEEVADLILFLASDRAGWITGGSFSIDGGRSQTCAR